MSRVIICPKTWAYHHNPKTKEETAAWRSSRTPTWKKIHQARFVGKVMLIFFFNEHGIIYQHVVPLGSQGQKQTVNSKYYWEVLKTLFAHSAKISSVARFKYEKILNFPVKNRHKSAYPNMGVKWQLLKMWMWKRWLQLYKAAFL